MTVRELLCRIDSRELTEWMAYAMIEPFGEDRADLRAGIIASTFANVHRPNSQQAYVPADFMAYVDQPVPDPEVVEAKLKMFFEGIAK